MAKLFECNGLRLAEWARRRVEDEDPFDFAQGRLDEDEDDEDGLCWLLPTADFGCGRRLRWARPLPAGILIDSFSHRRSFLLLPRLTSRRKRR